jgi:hypothetical protein
MRGGGEANGNCRRHQHDEAGNDRFDTSQLYGAYAVQTPHGHRQLCVCVCVCVCVWICVCVCMYVCVYLPNL